VAFGTLEPIAYDNIAGYAQLTRELNTSVQLGENCYGPRDICTKRSRHGPAIT
jgi:mandelate racemase